MTKVWTDSSLLSEHSLDGLKVTTHDNKLTKLAVDKIEEVIAMARPSTK